MNKRVFVRVFSNSNKFPFWNWFHEFLIVYKITMKSILLIYQTMVGVRSTRQFYVITKQNQFLTKCWKLKPDTHSIYEAKKDRIRLSGCSLYLISPYQLGRPAPISFNLTIFHFNCEIINIYEGKLHFTVFSAYI